MHYIIWSAQVENWGKHITMTSTGAYWSISC